MKKYVSSVNRNSGWHYTYLTVIVYNSLRASAWRCCSQAVLALWEKMELEYQAGGRQVLLLQQRQGRRKARNRKQGNEWSFQWWGLVSKLNFKSTLSTRCITHRKYKNFLIIKSLKYTLSVISILKEKIQFWGHLEWQEYKSPKVSSKIKFVLLISGHQFVVNCIFLMWCN